MDAQLQEFSEELKSAQKIMIIQGVNPDGDSVSSALALEDIFSEMGKDVTLYCPTSIPRHLRYFEGWDRIVSDMPHQFDLTVLVDVSSATLLDKVFTDQQLPILRSRPMVVIDHHDVEVDIPFQTLNVVDYTAVATGELLFDIAQKLGWEVPKHALNMFAVSIMYDSLGLSTPATTAKSIRTIAELVERGVNLPELDEQRKALSRRPIDITHYKGELLQRVEFLLDGKLATIDIPWEEIEKYSDKYNPSMLVLDDMRFTENVCVAIAYKTYPNGRITAKIRANYGFDWAAQIAEAFDGGGHPYAAGFKVHNRDFSELKKEVQSVVENIINQKGAQNDTETI